MSMRDDIEEILFSKEQLEHRVQELGAQITKDYEGKQPIFVGVLKGCFVFMADLMRAVDLHCQIDFMAVSSYGSGTTTSGAVQILKIVTLFDKPARRKAPIYADYFGYEVPDAFIVGYGLDFAEKYRNLPYIGVLKPEIYQ